MTLEMHLFFVLCLFFLLAKQVHFAWLAHQFLHVWGQQYFEDAGILLTLSDDGTIGPCLSF